MALTDKLALCLLADVKDDLGITDAGSDTKLERRILAASSAMLRYLGRSLRREVNRVEQVPGFGTAFLLMALSPIESIASITFDGTAVDATAYEKRDGGMIYAPDGWRNTASYAQTISPEPEFLPGTERRAYEVTYTGGYYFPNDTTKAGAELPFELAEAAVNFTVSLWRAKGRDEAIQAESVGDASVQFAGGGSGRDFIPPGVRSVLDSYRRVA